MLLEKKLEKGLFHLACRHHIMELILRSAFESVFGKTSFPDVNLFKRFQKKWARIDQSRYQPGSTDYHVSKHILPLITDIVSFATAQLSVEQPRDDYS